MITKENLIKAAEEMFDNIRVDECEKDIPNLEHYDVVIVHHENPDIRLIFATLLHNQYDNYGRWTIKLPWNDNESFKYTAEFDVTPHQLLYDVMTLVKETITEKIEYYGKFLEILNREDINNEKTFLFNLAR